MADDTARAGGQRLGLGEVPCRGQDTDLLHLVRPTCWWQYYADMGFCIAPICCMFLVEGAFLSMRKTFADLELGGGTERTVADLKSQYLTVDLSALRRRDIGARCTMHRLQAAK